MKKAESLTVVDNTSARSAVGASTIPEAQALNPSRQRSTPHALLIISADVRPEVQKEIAAGHYPRKDYFELANALQADTLDWSSTQTTRMSRLLTKVAGRAAAQAWLAFSQHHSYQVLYTDSERIGIPLALLLKLSRARSRHIMLAHMLSPWKKRIWFRWGRLHSHIETILCHASEQQRIMIKELGIPTEKLKLIPYQADERFWRPMTAQEAQAALDEAPASSGEATTTSSTSSSGASAGPELPLICSVGLEFRDYPTLIEAVREMEVRLEIAAASYWSDHHSPGARETLPPNVQVSSHPYLSLRHLYAASRFVVVPLLDVPNQAGITVILEAMAMGKAVIVSATRGQTDTVRDRRNHGYGRVERRVLSGFLEAPGVPEHLRHLPTGFYVKPGDPNELRKAITYLLAHPDVAAELGRNGRQVVEALMSLDAFVARVTQVIGGAN